MRKIIALILIAVMLGTVTGCRKSDDMNNSLSNSSALTTESIEGGKTEVTSSEQTVENSSATETAVQTSSKQETASEQNGKDNSSKNESSKPNSNTSSDKTNNNDSTNSKEETENATPASDFEYRISSEKVLLSQYIGNNSDVIIPSKIEGYPVVYLQHTFMSNQNVTSVEIPNTVETLDGAFTNCQNLKEVKFGSNVKELKGGAFRFCNSLENIILPAKLEILGELSFGDCANLKSVTVPKTIRRWEMGAFARNPKLTKINLEEGLKTIGTSAFWGCDTLETVTIPASVTRIEYEAFAECDILKSATFLGNAPTELIMWVFGKPNKEVIIYYKKGTSGWDTTTLKDDYTLKCIDE